MRYKAKYYVMLPLFVSIVLAQSTPDYIEKAVAQGRKTFASFDRGQTLEERVAKANGDIVIQTNRFKNISNSSEQGVQTIFPSMHAESLVSERVVLARVEKNVSAKTALGKFVFSISWLQVEENLKSPQRRSDSQPTLVLWPGGFIHVQGRLVKAYVADSNALIPGHEYILFLGKTDTADVYELLGNESYDLTSGRPIAVEKANSRVENAAAFDRLSFLNAVRNSVQFEDAKRG